MSYRPKRVFVKTENGAYTEITFQEFKTRRKTDTAFAERKFATVYTDTLVEFDKEGHKKMESDRRHLRHLRQMDKTHKLTYCGCIYEADREAMDPMLEVERNELIQKLQSCISQLEPVDKIIIIGLFFGNMKQKELAEIIGMTQSGVSKRLKQILKKLKIKLTE